MERRFVAAPFDRGQLHFSSAPVDVRVREPGGSGHARRFLNDGAYCAVGVRLLRQADGTAFAIVPASGRAFAAGQYRLKLTYERNPKDQDVEPQSERGESGPEQVQLDIPWEPAAG